LRPITKVFEGSTCEEYLIGLQHSLDEDEVDRLKQGGSTLWLPFDNGWQAGLSGER
jgi:hypothetical protein